MIVFAYQEKTKRSSSISGDSGLSSRGTQEFIPKQDHIKCGIGFESYIVEIISLNFEIKKSSLCQ